MGETNGKNKHSSTDMLVLPSGSLAASQCLILEHSPLAQYVQMSKPWFANANTRV